MLLFPVPVLPLVAIYQYYTQTVTWVLDERVWVHINTLSPVISSCLCAAHVEETEKALREDGGIMNPMQVRLKRHLA